MRPVDTTSSPSWGEMADALLDALGGILLPLEAAVIIPGLLPFVALAALLLVPVVVLGVVAAVPFAVWRLLHV